MNRKFIFILVLSFCVINNTSAQEFGKLPPFTKWYQNPLGVSPVSLHTANGIILPAVAAGAVLIFTSVDSTLTHKLSIYGDFGYTKGYYGSFSDLFHSNVGINFMLRKYMSVGIEITQAHVSDNINNTSGFGIRPFFRFYPYYRDSFKFFFSSGAGLIYFADNFPKPSGFFGDMREGTRLNGCPKYGIGAEFKIYNSFMFVVGIWHAHFSNGNYYGSERNPGHDSNGFSVGLTYFPTNNR
ncbi:hypothetical protein [Melioribacter roseus]|uniref:hypothetical protein n=1 Tax=Melioribacter roseus TaxID=1134405 RepID=UPI00059DB724|nr:hypothetical protein [Melioribacter roseus]